MEPLTVLSGIGFVCNIIQLLEQGLRLAHECREISKNSSAAEVKRTADFSLLAERVSQTCQQWSTSTVFTSIDQQTAICASRCVEAARRLSALAEDIWYKSDGKTERTLLDKGFKSLRNRLKIEEQRKHFSDVQVILQTSLLTGLRDELREHAMSNSQNLVLLNDEVRRLLDGDCRAAQGALSAIAALQTAMVSGMKQVSTTINDQTRVSEAAVLSSVDTLAAQHLASQRLLATSLAAITDQTKSSQVQLTRKLEALSLEDHERAALAQVLKKLSFDYMYGRENEIQARVRNYGETAKWIFGNFEIPELHESIYEERQQAHVERMKDVQVRLQAWLRSEDGIFFVEGKAGSGKSSLMSLMRKSMEIDGLAHGHLKQWTGGGPCVVLSFFFFRPAQTQLARSFEGLWRSLCHQLLQYHRDLQAILDANAPETLKSAVVEAQSASHAFRTDDLRTWCFYLLSICKSHVVILLDGLDEFQEYAGGDEGHASLLQTVQDLAKSNNHVKLICSSRPDEPFKSALRTGSFFTLQDVNYADIASFTFANLKDTTASEFAPSIAGTADGVFLWARVVADDLAKAARRGATRAELQQRLLHCPKEMHDLFRHMVSRQDDFYRKNPMPLMWLFNLSQKRFRTISLFELLLLSCSSFSSKDLLSNMRAGFSESFISRLTARALGFADEVLDRCGGLIAIEGTSTTGDYSTMFVRLIARRHASPSKLFWQLHDLKVRFVHRTAQDFLLEDGAPLLDTCGLSLSHGWLLLAIASVGVVCIDDYRLAFAANYDGDVAGPFREYIDLSLKAGTQSESGQCHEALEWLVARLAGRMPLISTVAPPILLPCFPWRMCLPACTEIPLKLRLAIIIAGQYSNIVDLFVVPLVQQCQEEHRSIAAAYALVRSMQSWEERPRKSDSRLKKLYGLLTLCPPLATLPLLNEKTDPETRSKAIVLDQHPFWLHFISDCFFGLARTRTMRLNFCRVAEMMFASGVSRDETCVRSISTWRGSVVFYPTVCYGGVNLRQQQTPADEPVKEYDHWLIQQRVDDLPKLARWRLDGTVLNYSPAGSSYWLNLSELEGETSGFDITAHVSNTREFWRVTNTPILQRICMNLVSAHVAEIPDIHDMIEEGWGFKEGRACHHLNAERCQHCGFVKERHWHQDQEARQRWVRRVEDDLIARGLVYESSDDDEEAPRVVQM